MPDGGSVTYDDKDGVARITLNRPDLLNAINTDMLRQLSSILEQVRANNEVKAVMITGAAERAFSAGADIGFLHKATTLEVRELTV